MTDTIPQDTAQRLYLAMLAGNAPESSFLELRAPRVAQEWFPVRDTAPLMRRIVEIGADHDVYVGVQPRARRGGGLDAIDQCWTLHADLDTEEAVEALERFRPAPAVVVLSGSEDHRHAYWPLRRPLTPAQARQANRRLAHALGADMAATDAARILRPPDTLNHKHARPRPVRCILLEAVGYTAAEVVGRLPDPPVGRPAAVPRPSTALLDASDPLRAIPATEYVPALLGVELPRDGKVCCPFHDDRTPSLHVYDGGSGWYCFGCERGGSIIDLGAEIYSVEPRGSGFHTIRRRLAADLLGAIGEAA